MKRVIRAKTSSEISQRELCNIALARQAGAEGIVLLKNEGALPLKGGKAALYGAGIRHSTIGGVGSGETRPREIVHVDKGFENAGWIVTTEKWLDDYDEIYRSSEKKWREEIGAALKKIPQMEQMDYATAHCFVTPDPVQISEEDVRASETDTAVYMLTRQAGEGADRRPEKGDYYVTDAEYSHIKALCKAYDKVVLVLNVGGVIDLNFADELGVNAIVLYSQGGMQGGNALADVLTGEVSPCGRLADSWAYKYEDYPCCDTYAYLNGDLGNEDYNEGIYVGYRYFDSFGKAPRYPFGFGLSYTSFEQTIKGVSCDNMLAHVSVAVKNIGATAGKEVVQLYACPPEGELKKAYQSLVAFGKTKLLEPGESETIELSFPVTTLASYCEKCASWVIEKGDYLLLAGASSRDTKPAAALRFEESLVTDKAVNICPTQKRLEELCAPAFEREQTDAPVIIVDTQGFTAAGHDYSEKEYRDEKVDAVMKKLTHKDMAILVVGAGFIGPIYNTSFGAIGNTTSRLVKKGVQNLAMCDGPAGLNLNQKSLKPKQNFFTVPAVPEMLRNGMVKRVIESTQPRENETRTVYYQYMTAWPCSNALAQSWDVELVERIGEGIAKEMVETGVSCWLAPAMNIHRNVLCGRNYEYYSEDPFLSGTIAAAAINGVQKTKGVYCTPKHFCCNNQESNRNKVSSNVSEQALREIYLRGFEIAVKQARPAALMSSYNKVNGVYTANSYDLLTKLLRCEWGFEGFVMTDWFSTGKGLASYALAVSAGNDLSMPGSAEGSREILDAIKSGKIAAADLERCARNILRAVLHSRMYQ